MFNSYILNGLCFEIERMEPLMQSMWPKPIEMDSPLMCGMDVENN